MRVLILSVTAGQGHNSTAKAVESYLSQLGADVKIVDVFDYINRILAKTISEGYNVSTKVAAKPYEQIYSHYEKRSKTADDISAMRVTNSLFASKLKKYLDDFSPDAVVCTHVFAAAIIGVLKRKGQFRQPVYGIVTDFTVHPFWEEAIHIDYLVTPNELLNVQCYKKGFKRSQILPLGIPIDPKFAKRSNTKENCRRLLGLDPQKFTVLFMSGSMGYGDVAGTVKKLDEVKVDYQIISICGNNSSAKEKIDKLDLTKKILNLGYVTNVDVIMDAADCIITKPGGLTTSEALAKNLPIIIANPIPGQEVRNTEFLLNNGCAMYISPTCPADEIIYQFFYFSEREATAKKAISLIRRPNSTKELCEHIAKHCGK